MFIKKPVAVLSALAIAAAFYGLGAFFGLPFIESDKAAGDVHKTLNESVVTGNVPKKLNTFDPFWGIPKPVDGAQENSVAVDDYVYFRPEESAFPNWISWNLDLATEKDARYKFEKFLSEGQTLACDGVLRKAIDECYRWAWRKPYGNTNVVVGPLYNQKLGNEPYAYYVAVCKQERLNVPMPLGYSSLAYIIPADAQEKNVYEYSLSVNALQYKSGYELFDKLPRKVQGQIKEMTAYELLCSFQEVPEGFDESMQPEIESAEYTADPVQDAR